MLKKVLTGWVLVTAVYFLTYMITARMIMLISRHDIFNRQSGIIIGIFLVLVPYAAAGIYSSKAVKSLTGALLVCSVPVLCERLLIFAIGYSLYISGGDGWIIPNVKLMGFIRGEAAPYYTTLYIFAGIISILLTLTMALVGKDRAKGRRRINAV